MKCLSIRQPWAYLITAGLKDIENRDWPTRLRGPVLIHAGKYRPGEAEIIAIEEEFGIRIPRASLQYGGVIGQATITDCVESSASRWFCGEFGFVLTGARVLPFRPLSGRLGFFDVE